MNYPVKVKSAFTKIRYQMHDAWENLRALKRSISCLVRSIDDVADRVSRSRQLLHGIPAQGPACRDAREGGRAHSGGTR